MFCFPNEVDNMSKGLDPNSYRALNDKFCFYVSITAFCIVKNFALLQSSYVKVMAHFVIYFLYLLQDGVPGVTRVNKKIMIHFAYPFSTINL